ncbi:MAG: hypothetical protein GY771_15140, partial [bacterium]|nr:hypothetical protein [bacterium]
MFKYSILAIALLSVFSGSALADTATLYPTDDSYTMGSQPDNNFGYQEYAFVGSYDNLELYATFLFDLSSYSGV